jgi:hypothetical protein
LNHHPFLLSILNSPPTPNHSLAHLLYFYYIIFLLPYQNYLTSSSKNHTKSNSTLKYPNLPLYPIKSSRLNSHLNLLSPPHSLPHFTPTILTLYKYSPNGHLPNYHQIYFLKNSTQNILSKSKASQSLKKNKKNKINNIINLDIFSFIYLVFYFHLFYFIYYTFIFPLFNAHMIKIFQSRNLLLILSEFLLIYFNLKPGKVPDSFLLPHLILSIFLLLFSSFQLFLFFPLIPEKIINYNFFFKSNKKNKISNN